MKTNSEIKQCIDAQTQYIKNTMKPAFAPSDGRCYDCNNNIYQDYKRRGWDLGTAASSLITGCPHCNYSFCE